MFLNKIRSKDNPGGGGEEKNSQPPPGIEP
jgi:hypothetical protein